MLLAKIKNIYAKFNDLQTQIDYKDDLIAKRNLYLFQLKKITDRFSPTNVKLVYCYIFTPKSTIIPFNNLDKIVKNGDSVIIVLNGFDFETPTFVLKYLKRDNVKCVYYPEAMDINSLKLLLTKQFNISKFITCK